MKNKEKGVYMTIDENINAMFSERNQELFFNKLLMDIDNNVDTFKLASKNTVMIEIAKLLSSLKKIYANYSQNIDDSKIKRLFSDTKNALVESVNVVIEDKGNSSKEYVKNHNAEKIDSKYLKSFHRHIDDTESEFEDILTLAVKQNIEVDFVNNLLKLYPCVDENMHNEMLNLINVNFCGNMINRIKSESIHRNMTLKNMTEETYKKYLELSKSSVDLAKNDKIKIKKEGSNN